MLTKNDLQIIKSCLEDIRIQYTLNDIDEIRIRYDEEYPLGELVNYAIDLVIRVPKTMYRNGNNDFVFYRVTLYKSAFSKMSFKKINLNQWYKFSEICNH